MHLFSSISRLYVFLIKINEKFNINQVSRLGSDFLS